MTNKQRVLQFLHEHPMATLSTVNASDGKPQAALIAFAELDSLEVIFETFYNTRKYNNLQHSNCVALVVGWDAKHQVTLQYEGTARQIPDDEVPKYRSIFRQKKTPCTEEFLLDPHVRLFLVRPTWIALSDYTGERPEVMEISF